MKVHHTLICFFFLSLQDGNAEVTDERFLLYGVAGRDVSVRCNFDSSGTWKMFCRETCEGENILINTSAVRAQKGRYRIEYRYEYYTIHVTISELTTSDTGRYRCVLGGSSSPASIIQFGVVVAEALLDGNDDHRKKHFYKEAGSSLTVGCSVGFYGKRKSFCRGACGREEVFVDTYDDRAQRGRYSIGYVSQVLYVSITQLRRSDSGRYRCYLNGAFIRDFELTVTDAATTTTTAQSLSSSSGSSTPSFTFTEQSEGAPTDVMLYVGLTLAVIIILLSVALLIFCKKRSSKAQGRPVETERAAVTEDESRKLIYSEVRFFKTKVGSPSSASCSDTGEVIYSAPRVHDDPLYSTVA